MGAIPETVLDSVRYLIMCCKDANGHKMGTLRLYASFSDYEIVIPEEWQDRPDDVYICKADMAEVFYRTFKKAEEAL